MTNCAIWPSEPAAITVAGSFMLYHSPRAGGLYALDGYSANVIPTLSIAQRALLTTQVVDHNRLSTQYFGITKEILESLSQRRPLRISDKKRRFFEYLVSRGYKLGERISLLEDGFFAPPSTEAGVISAWIECANDKELADFQIFLKEEDLVIVDVPGYRLTPKGYAQLELAEIGGADTRQAFVAMWFDPSMTEAYEKGLKRAIEDAGFRPFRIDRKEHNNKIDDEIVAEIRRSRFVVADFTCGLTSEGNSKQALARGGVYYEAGFAQGLGTPVIWTVRGDRINHVHFDTRQFAHIVWDAPADLYTKLYNRIRATIPGSA